jgi:hypothetical protein
MFEKTYEKSELSNVKDIVFSTFMQMEEQLNCRIPKSFLLVLVLFLSIKGRINFLQLERFSNRCESGFRYFFEQGFDFLTFNKTLIMMNIKGKTALAFDPSFISKAGKKNTQSGLFLKRLCRQGKMGTGILWISGFGCDQKNSISLVWIPND